MIEYSILNVDGSVLGNPKRGAFGGCHRNDMGAWINDFCGYFNDTIILHLESLAMFHGLVLAWGRGLRVVEC